MEIDLARYIGNKIKIFRNEKKMTQTDLGNIAEISKQAISNYERGYRSPQQDELFAISGALEISIDELFPPRDGTITGIYSQLEPERKEAVYIFATQQLEEQNNVIQLDSHIEEIDYKEVALYGGASAGTGQQVFDNPIEWVSVPVDVIPQQPYDITLKVVGDSMEPAFEDGEYIFINKTQEVRSGQFVVVIVDDESYLKKIYIEENRVRLVSLNKEYEDIIVDNKQDINIIGTVVL